MEIRSAAPPAPVSGPAIAPSPPAPQGRPGPNPAPVDGISFEIVDGILSAGDGSREWVSLRLLPPLPADAEETGLVARVEGPIGGVLRLMTALGTIVPQRPLAATPGSTIRFEFLARVPLAAVANPARPPASPPAADARPPPDPAAPLAAMPEALLPEPGSERLAAALQLLLAAAPAGFLRLRQATGRHSADASGLGARSPAQPDQRLAETGNGPYWRVVPLAWPQPGLSDSYLLRREAKSNAPEAPEEPARFMLEVSLRRLGPLQLDGLYRRGRFDLVLRSRLPLAAAAREEAARRFHAILSIGELAGGLAFTVVPHFPVSAIPEPQSLGIEV